MISEEDGLIKAQHGEDVQIKTWIQCIDHEIPKNIAIDMISSRIFAITTMGNFSCWDIKTFKLIYSKEFYKTAKQIYSFK
jgi:hypothetical protein